MSSCFVCCGRFERERERRVWWTVLCVCTLRVEQGTVCVWGCGLVAFVYTPNTARAVELTLASDADGLHWR